MERNTHLTVNSATTVAAADSTLGLPLSDIQQKIDDKIEHLSDLRQQLEEQEAELWQYFNLKRQVLLKLIQLAQYH